MAYLALIVEDVVINKWEISDQGLLIGRAKGCDVQIDDQSVSSRHARVLVEKDPYFNDNQLVFIEDLNSTNGTEHNGRTVSKAQLNDGDDIKIGFNHFRFISEDGLNLDETAVILN
ncbi:MAG: FHA domain-containing protein [Gammaproteobacteria bacterium]|nr:FHA domain-containing protein [Gammaproteobacteria bacterium]MDH5628661.1 FHA domain-containing protein [Gammaproteobacteria bacterium]